MPFPNATRVLYGKNPLENVICQLKFPPILKIDAELPAEFQERIRKIFPNFSEAASLNIEVPQELKGRIPQEVFSQILTRSQKNKNYEFSSEDGLWQINLTNTFIALSTKKYNRWEEFKNKLQIPINALVEVYSPVYFSRIGLRYRDVIRRSILGLESVGWHELLSPYLSGILGSADVRDRVKGFQQQYEIQLADGKGIVKIVTALVEARDNSEVSFLIDSDFSDSNKTNLNSAMERLDYFNVRASRLIRWAITDKLHQAMEPEQIP